MLRGHLKIVPDLVVDVISPDDFAEEVQGRVEDFLRAKVPLMWVLYPYLKLAVVYSEAGDRISRLHEDAVLDGGDVLPGFSVPLRELFTLPDNLMAEGDETPECGRESPGE